MATKMASKSIDLFARVAHLFSDQEKKIARAARFLSFFAVVLHNYNAVL